jgi:amino acid transporter
VNAGVWITVCFIPMIFMNYLPVKYYGELEVATCSIKVIAIVGYVSFPICRHVPIPSL